MKRKRLEHKRKISFRATQFSQYETENPWESQYNPTIQKDSSWERQESSWNQRGESIGKRAKPSEKRSKAKRKRGWT